MNPRKKPKFKRHGEGILKRVGEKWRRPRGWHSKLRKKMKSKGKVPSPGYGAPKELRFLHPSGYKEVLIRNLKDLEKIDKEKEAIKIASTVGKKKRNMIIEKAKNLGIKILNP
jgi:large subunit ribosomal protein L32e